MTRLFSRWLPCVTLGAWSAILLQIYLSGRVQAFLIPTFRPYVLLAGLAMAALAVMFAIVPSDAACCDTEECGHPLSRFNAGKALTFLILLVPILTAAYVSPDGFGKTAMMNRGVITDASALGGAPSKVNTAPPALPLPSKDGAPAADATASSGTQAAAEPSPGDYLQHTPEGFIVAEVLDLLYAAQDNALRKDFEGKPVQLIGQLMPDVTSNASGHRFKAVRMFMTCCAADARPVATLVEASALPNLPEMTWVKVTGAATFPIENGKRVPVIKADMVEKTEPPSESMLY